MVESGQMSKSVSPSSTSVGRKATTSRRRYRKYRDTPVRIRAGPLEQHGRRYTMRCLNKPSLLARGECSYNGGNETHQQVSVVAALHSLGHDEEGAPIHGVVVIRDSLTWPIRLVVSPEVLNFVSGVRFPYWLLCGSRE